MHICMSAFFPQQILIRRQKRKHVPCWSNFCVILPRLARPCKIAPKHTVITGLCRCNKPLICRRHQASAPGCLAGDPCPLSPCPSRVQWSQFKNYFLFKLEKVMDDFRASAPEQRGPANPNVESIPFEDMKERILKIVKGYNGWVPGAGPHGCAPPTPPTLPKTTFLHSVEFHSRSNACASCSRSPRGTTREPTSSSAAWRRCVQRRLAPPPPAEGRRLPNFAVFPSRT